jgi:hypothetical protein
VSVAKSASRSGTLHEYGVPLGVVLGLVVGGGGALVAERADRRVDDLDALGTACGCSATKVPGGISAAEMARALDRAGDWPVTVVPLRAHQSPAAEDLAQLLVEAWQWTPSRDGRARPPITMSPPFEASPASMSAGSGATVLVVGSGERVGVVQETAQRLRLLGRDPAWAVLVPAGEAQPPGDHER